MALSLTNSKDIVANSITVIKGNREVDVLATIDAVQGFAPSTLNSLEKLAKAMNDDANFFTTLSTDINKKQNTLSNGTLITGCKSLLVNTTTTSKIKNIVGTNLTLTEDENNITIAAAYDKSALDTKFDNKQNKFIIAETLPAGTSRLFDPSSSNFRAINVTSPLSITAPNSDHITIACDSYTKQEVRDKITELVDSAPNLLNTLGEISRYLGNPTDTTTSLLSIIGTKANSTDTFARSKIDQDYLLGGLGNKRFISLGTTSNELIFQIQDTMGNMTSDAFVSALTLKMNTDTKQISCYIPNSLFVNNINVMDQIGLKVNSADLGNYATTTALSAYLKLDNNQLLVPKIVLTDTNVGPPTTGNNSVGSRLVLYNLQSGGPGSSFTNIGIGVDLGPWMWFGIDGTSTNPPLSIGGWRFYQNTNIVATIKANGDFICKDISCNSLLVNTRNILTELDNKLTNNTGQNITCNVLTAKSSVITDNKPFQHVSTTISNNGTGGFASLFVDSLNSSNIVVHSMGMKIGNNTGGIL